MLPVAAGVGGGADEPVRSGKAGGVAKAPQPADAHVTRGCCVTCVAGTPSRSRVLRLLWVFGCRSPELRR
ncbi:hypothetical protein BTHE_1962 [Bifidobacterium thermophilum]|nr:hypothetical protein BTHE_1962 [Bifidobacterium thermophilum]